MFTQLDSKNTTQKTKTYSQPVSYPASLAASLLYYSQINPVISTKLKGLTKNIVPQGSVKPPFKKLEGIELLMPTGQEIALRRSKWLIDYINNNPANTRLAAQLLTTASRPRTLTDPKQIVVGIAATSIPGVTVGRITKKIEKMMIVIRRDLAFEQPLTLTQQITQAGLEVLSNALNMAKGNFKKIEPEIGNWFLDSRQLSFYCTHSFTLSRIESELNRLSINHSVMTQNDEITIIAISPSVNTSYSQIRWELDPLEP
jgi:hypothetical protein